MEFLNDKQKKRVDEIKKHLVNITGERKDEERINFCISPFKEELQSLVFICDIENEESKLLNFIIKILFQNKLSFVDACLVLSYVYKRINMSALTYSTEFDEEKLRLKHLLNNENGIYAADEILNALFNRKEFFSININDVLYYVCKKMKANMFFNKY